LVNVLGPTISVMTALALVFSVVIAKVAFAIGIFLSFFQIMKQLQAMSGIVAISMWKIYLPLIAIGAVVGGATYLFLKYSGALDKAKQSAANVAAQLKRIQGALEGVEKIGEEEIGVEEGRRIAHERTVADIEEDLERERSKGLWANQMAIKDLEKRLGRENEDWDRYLKERGGMEEGAAGTTSGLFDNIFQDATGLAEDLGKIDFWVGIREKTEEIWEWLKEPRNWNNVGKKIANLFMTFGKWARDAWLMAWDNWIKYIFTADFWIALVENIKLIAVTIWNGVKEGLKGFGDEVADWILGPTDKMFERLNKNTTELIKKAKELQDIGEIEKARKLLEMDVENYQNIADTYGKLSDDLSFENIMGDVGEKIWDWTEKLFPPISKEESGQPSWFNFQHGGIIPGLRNQPIPIIAHGGERVIPAGEVASEGNITVNINNPTVRSQEDINSIAREVSNVLGQRQKFSRLGSF